jgi:hypothetical protein
MRWTSKKCSVKTSTNSLKIQNGTLSHTKRWVSSHAAPKETTVKTIGSKQWRKSTCRKWRKIKTIPCSNLDLKLMWPAKTPTLLDQQRSAVLGRSTLHVSSRIVSPTMHPSLQGVRALLNSRPQSKQNPRRATQDRHPGTVFYAVQLHKRLTESPNKSYNPLESEKSKGFCEKQEKIIKSIINQRQKLEKLNCLKRRLQARPMLICPLLQHDSSSGLDKVSAKIFVRAMRKYQIRLSR